MQARCRPFFVNGEVVRHSRPAVVGGIRATSCACVGVVFVHNGAADIDVLKAGFAGDVEQEVPVIETAQVWILLTPLNRFAWEYGAMVEED